MWKASKVAVAQRRRGFTIVELLVAIVVIAILASITVVAYNGMQDRAYATDLMSRINTYKKLLQLYHTEHGRFPDTNDAFALGSYGSCLGKLSDYPAEDGWPAGVCMQSIGSTTWNEFASDDFTNALQPYSRSTLPSGKIRTATEMYNATQGTRYRGIYFEGAGGNGNNDWAYMEYVVKGDVACPQSDYKRYNAAPQNVTFCGYLVRQAD